MKAASNITSRKNVMRRIKHLATPAFVINRHAFEKNCQSMLSMAKERNLRMRPHVKTHKTVQGAWIQATGRHDPEGQDDSLVTGFVASTLPEVKMLVEDAPKCLPFQDVLYGVPISESKLHALDALRRKMPPNGQIHILIDNPAQVTFVEDHVKSTANKRPFSVFLKLDTGYHRAGITCDERGVDLALAILQSPHLVLKGVYSHCGHSYDESDELKQKDIARVDNAMITTFLNLLQGRLDSVEGRDALNSSLIISIGSTPSARHHYSTLDLPSNTTLEIHPGNYTLFDRQQLWTGACSSEADVAGRVISTVIGHYPDRNTLMLDAGATALTKDATPQGGVCSIGGHEDDLACFKMSQEVTLVRPKDANATLDYDKFPLGTMVNLLPNHSCLAAACFERYYIIDDPTCSFSPEQEIVDEWIPAKYFDI